METVRDSLGQFGKSDSPPLGQTNSRRCTMTLPGFCSNQLEPSGTPDCSRNGRSEAADDSVATPRDAAAPEVVDPSLIGREASVVPVLISNPTDPPGRSLGRR